MAKQCKIEKHNRMKPGTVKYHNRCPICGRPRAYMRRFDMCRICFRKLAGNGQIPGVTKSSW